MIINELLMIWCFFFYHLIFLLTYPQKPPEDSFNKNKMTHNSLKLMRLVVTVEAYKDNVV